jgi:phosphoserine phosphatase
MSEAIKQAPTAAPGRSADQTPERRGGRVLLVDPDPESRSSHRADLAEAGYRVMPVGTRAEADAIIAQDSPDVVVLDASLCHPDDAALPVRRGDSPRPPVTAIVLAHPGTPLDSVAASGMRIDACLLRPVATRELLLHVEAAIRWHDQRLAPLALRELRGDQARMWNVLLDFCRSTGRELDLDSVLERIVTAASQMTCSRRVSLMLPDEKHEYLTIAKAIGMDESTRKTVRVPVGDKVAGRAFASGRRVTARPARRTLAGVNPLGESFVSMPIVASTISVTGQSVGVLNITHRFDDRPFEDWELEFIDLLGGIAGSVIDDTLWRQARESLLKIERDLDLARSIQRSTFPDRLPTLDGFDIAAWSQPAEETGGDSYDVIGYRRSADGVVRLAPDEADRAMLLLADATGHGIGPALSVTQVRAMMRMAVRMDPDVERIVRSMNEQLCADLPEGRFITAWLGDIDAATGTLTSFSAGQGPLLHYDAAADVVTTLSADTLPLGIVEDLDVAIVAPLVLAPGDVFAVISDGVLDVVNERGESFGTDRATNLIRAHAGDAAETILQVLRRSVEQHGAQAPDPDDRTVIIVKRCAGGGA